jgi:hypothetical protein
MRYAEPRRGSRPGTLTRFPDFDDDILEANPGRTGKQKPEKNIRIKADFPVNIKAVPSELLSFFSRCLFKHSSHACAGIPSAGFEKDKLFHRFAPKCQYHPSNIW